MTTPSEQEETSGHDARRRKLQLEAALRRRSAAGPRMLLDLLSWTPCAPAVRAKAPQALQFPSPYAFRVARVEFDSRTQSWHLLQWLAAHQSR